MYWTKSYIYYIYKYICILFGIISPYHYHCICQILSCMSYIRAIDKASVIFFLIAYTDFFFTICTGLEHRCLIKEEKIEASHSTVDLFLLLLHYGPTGEMPWTMVLILDCNSGHKAHTWTKKVFSEKNYPICDYSSSNQTCLKHIS